MRPRPDAAENPEALARRFASFVGASMRPRPDAAENRAGGEAAFQVGGLQ